MERPHEVVSIRRVAGGHVLEARMWLASRRSEVFPFFADALNLEAITPDWLRFSVLTPRPLTMRAGAVIDYRLRLHGVPLRWRSSISTWDPPRRFVDRQLSGPYSHWVHEHRFIDAGGGVVIADRIFYRIRGGTAIDRLANSTIAKRDLTRIFRYRQQALRAQFAV